MTCRPLTPRQQRYVSFVLSGLSEAESARQAGYGPAYSKKAPSRVGAIPAVKAAIQQEQIQLRQRARYDVEQAVAEIDKAVVFAYQQKNSMAIAKLLENKGKLFGLYIDRAETTVSVNLIAALQAAQARLVNVDTCPSIPSQSKIDWRPKIAGDEEAGAGDDRYGPQPR